VSATYPTLHPDHLSSHVVSHVVSHVPLNSARLSVVLTLPSYFDAIKRIAEPTYMPTDQDILRARVKTTGITWVQPTLPTPTTSTCSTCLNLSNPRGQPLQAVADTAQRNPLQDRRADVQAL
jgi:hypothetical protein